MIPQWHQRSKINLIEIFKEADSFKIHEKMQCDRT